MHGYQANLELERREIRDWAGISRPQVYYSLEKLARAGLIRGLETGEPAAGPERSAFETSAKGKAALAEALEREEWTTQRERPAFLTWVALSWQARPGVFEKQLERRKEFLEKRFCGRRKFWRRFSTRWGTLIMRRCGWWIHDRTVSGGIGVVEESGAGIAEEGEGAAAGLCVGEI